MEFNASFLKFLPTVAVILNIDEDHLDFYKDIDDIERAFLEYARRTPEDGWCVGCGEDERVLRVMRASGRNTRSYSLGLENDLRPENLTYDPKGRARHRGSERQKPLCEIPDDGGRQTQPVERAGGGGGGGHLPPPDGPGS